MPPEPLRAVSCTDSAANRRAVEAILLRGGFHIFAEVGSALDAIAAASVGQPDVVVLDIALTGDLGLRALRELHDAAPACAVIVVSSFETLRPASLAAGAYEFVGNADLRALERALRRLATNDSGGWRLRPPAVPSPVLQVDAPTSEPSTAGSTSTNAPPS